MNGTSRERLTPQPSLAEKLAQLALPADPKSPHDKISLVHFRDIMRRMQNAPHREQAMITVLLFELGFIMTHKLELLDSELNDRVNQATQGLHNISIPEMRAVIGKTIPPNARVRQVITQVDQEVSDFYGIAYNAELDYAAMVVLRMVEQAAAEQGGQLRSS